MSNHSSTYQQTNTISVKRAKIIDIAADLEYSKTDLRVFLILLTQLEGHTVPKNFRSDYVDPLNFRIIDVNAIADTLSLTKKKVRKCIEFLHDEGIIEEGSNDTITHGYRFTF